MTPIATQDRRAHYDAFVTQVRDLCTTSGIRAALAQGRGRRIEQCTALHRYLTRPAHGYGARRAHYTVASLIALEPHTHHHPPTAEPAGEAVEWRRRLNLGATLATAVVRRPVSAQAFDNKLQLLARLSTDVLHPRLPGLAEQLLQAGCRPDWAVLLEDLSLWDIDRPAVVTRWMDSFYLALPDDDRPHPDTED
ncbi:type I-E CRISPR-associated protein Cse2/CasB [Streptomyces sp. SKN60]|uniref:type I-E CRISPR-associated protein Cse2/CasB n=1 Tax=Streptomyces sp. SKN60 TaxID=2855506 RepID=UPI002247D36D|nr:type I-E CRISPR-associated protein Cse2/CasB [Streptomyces sp. SKN60]MCX2182668.1 type I-E CRISPR-associated protein Cse2/CasB [Streptomyces sp. SKN60]